MKLNIAEAPVSTAVAHTTQEGPQDALVLVASGFDDFGGGGLFAIRDTGVDALDHVATTGLAAKPDGTLIARVVWTDDDPQATGVVMIYDAVGLRSSVRIDELKDPHGATWFGDELVVVSTQTNSVLALDEYARVTRRWNADGDGDCWHLNCPIADGDRVLVSAFGTFDRHRAWIEPGAREGSGIVVDLESGTQLLSGLNAPHDPLRIDGGWLICNSGDQSIDRLSDDGTLITRTDLGGWTRGLAVDEQFIYVGVTPHYLQGGEGTASIAILDRPTLREVARRPLPCKQVFSLQWVNPALVEAMRHGVGDGPIRRAVEGHETLDEAFAVASPYGASVGHALEVRLEETVPAAVVGRWLGVHFRATNVGESVFHSGSGDETLVGALWVDEDGAPLEIQARARLAASVVPGATSRGTLRIVAPPEPGQYHLRVSALREGSPWFDTIDSELGQLVDVSVEPAR